MYDAPPESAAKNSVHKNTCGGYLLGAFVVFQLVFIPIGNYIKLVPARFPENHGEIDGELQARIAPETRCREPVQSLIDATAWACSRWCDVSGQGQCWALFASFGERASFPIVELRWPESEHRAPVRLKSYFEPEDPTNYFYWPEPCCRVWNYDNRMALIHFAITPKTVPDQEAYRRECVNCVREMRRSMSAYLRWKTDRYLATQPGTPRPETVTLIARVLPDPLPGESYRNRPPAFEIPLARWTPNRQVPDDEVPLEAWDPIDHQFLRLKLEGGP